MSIATEESFFVLKYSPEAVEKARENPESINEDGIEDAFDVRLLKVFRKHNGILRASDTLLLDFWDVCSGFLSPSVQSYVLC